MGAQEKKEKPINFMDLIHDKKSSNKEDSSYDSTQKLREKIGSDPEIIKELKEIADEINKNNGNK